MHVCIYTHVHVDTHTHTRVHACTLTYMDMRAHMHTYTQTHVHTRACMCACILLYTHHTCKHTHVKISPGVNFRLTGDRWHRVSPAAPPALPLRVPR